MELYLGNTEFGEVYHAALAMLCQPDVAVTLEPGSLHDVFRHFLVQVAGEDRVKSWDKPLPRGKKVPSKKKITNSRGVIIERYKAGGAVGGLIEFRKKIVGKSSEYLKRQMSGIRTGKPCVLIWVRNSAVTDPTGASKNHDAWRDSTPDLLEDLEAIVTELDCSPVFIGASLGQRWSRGHHLIEFFADEAFRGADSIMKQLGMFTELKSAYNVVGSVGMMSGGMDGPTLFADLPAVTLMHSKKVTKILDYDGVVPGYHVVKTAGNGRLAAAVRADVNARLKKIRAE